MASVVITAAEAMRACVHADISSRHQGSAVLKSRPRQAAHQNVGGRGLGWWGGLHLSPIPSSFSTLMSPK